MLKMLGSTVTNLFARSTRFPGFFEHLRHTIAESPPPSPNGFLRPWLVVTLNRSGKTKYMVHKFR